MEELLALVVLVRGLWFMHLGSSCGFMMLGLNNNHMDNVDGLRQVHIS